MGHHILAIKTHIVVLGGPRGAKMLVLKLLGLVPECARERAAAEIGLRWHEEKEARQLRRAGLYELASPTL